MVSTDKTRDKVLHSTGEGPESAGIVHGPDGGHEDLVAARPSHHQLHGEVVPTSELQLKVQRGHVLEPTCSWKLPSMSNLSTALPTLAPFTT